MTVKFWRTTGKYGCFSNFSKHPVVMNKKKYRTSEHYYQAMKHIDTDPLYANKIANAPTSKESKNLAHARRIDEEWWDSVKLDVMREVVRAKAEQHPQIKELLLGSNDRKIEENSPYDDFWGTGKNGRGENWLGRIWMEVRDELRNG